MGIYALGAGPIHCFSDPTFATDHDPLSWDEQRGCSGSAAYHLVAGLYADGFQHLFHCRWWARGIICHKKDLDSGGLKFRNRLDRARNRLVRQPNNAIKIA
jgi:hypothetical protein